MTVFDKTFCFYDSPRGGTDQLTNAKAHGFLGGFGNVIDFDPALWAQHRADAKRLGMFFGPWGRTGHPPPQGTGFERTKAQLIRSVAKSWDNAPYVWNNEKEIDNANGTLNLQWEADLAGDDDCAISMEAWPFGNVDWSRWPKAVLPQIFPVESSVSKDPAAVKSQWHLRGIKCVYFTFGTYGGMKPSDFDLKAPYSLFTADAMVRDAASVPHYALWKPTSTGFQGCLPPPKPSTAATRKGMTDLAKAWEQAQGKETPLTRITIARRIVEEFYTNGQWARMAPTIKAVLDQEQDEG